MKKLDRKRNMPLKDEGKYVPTTDSLSAHYERVRLFQKQTLCIMLHTENPFTDLENKAFYFENHTSLLDYQHFLASFQQRLYRLSIWYDVMPCYCIFALLIMSVQSCKGKCKGK